MTCIVGYCEGGKVWMGSDSMACRSGCKIIIDYPKISIIENDEGDSILIGGGGSLRELMIVKHSFELPTNSRKDDMEFVLLDVVLEIENCLTVNKSSATANENFNCLTDFLIGYHGKLYHIACDGGVLSESLCYASEGSGGEVATGAMYAVCQDAITPEEKIIIALEASARHVDSVSAPFHILSI